MSIEIRSIHITGSKVCREESGDFDIFSWRRGRHGDCVIRRDICSHLLQAYEASIMATADLLCTFFRCTSDVIFTRYALGAHFLQCILCILLDYLVTAIGTRWSQLRCKSLIFLWTGFRFLFKRCSQQCHQSFARIFKYAFSLIWVLCLSYLRRNMWYLISAARRFHPCKFSNS